MKSIVSISATSRPDNYTARALAIVNDELGCRDVSLTCFDARDLSLSFPGHPPTEDARRLRSAVEAAAGVVIATPESIRSSIKRLGLAPGWGGASTTFSMKARPFRLHTWFQPVIPREAADVSIYFDRIHKTSAR